MNSKFLSRAAVGVLAMIVPAISARAGLLITEAMPSSGVTVDWFELTNTGTQAVDLTNYRVDDSSFSFAASVALANVASLPAGQSAVFLESAAGADIAAFRSYWAGPVALGLIGYYSGNGVGLSATSDGLVVFDGAGAEATPRASFGAATTGASFYFDSNTGALLGVSATGQPGVYNSTGSYNGNTTANVGSPILVPEPAACAWMGLAGGIAVLTAVRRKRRAA